MKKLFSLLLVFMVICPFALPVAAGDETPAYTSGNYTYTLDADGNAVITGYNGSGETLVVPAALDGYTVTGIGDWAFFGCDTLTFINLPFSLQSIGDNAFYQCEALLSINLPEGLQSIGDEAFEDCRYLTFINIPSSLRSIGSRAFTLCYSLVSILVSPDNAAFMDIDGVLFSKDGSILIAYPASKADTEYTVPQGVQTIGDGAFTFCDQLASIRLPASLEAINDWAFDCCFSLPSINLPASIRFISESAFNNCYSVTLTVPRESYAQTYAEANEIPYQFDDSANGLNP